MNAPELHHIGFKIVSSYLLYWGICELERLNKNQAASTEALRDINFSLKEINIELRAQMRELQAQTSSKQFYKSAAANNQMK
jgi:hypothetical protein